MWWNPATAVVPVIEGQAWPNERKSVYDRLPARAEGPVPQKVWDLSTNSSGLMIRFRANSSEINIRYVVDKKAHALPHMPATGVSGVDLYAVTSDGELRWCSGKYTFGDTIEYRFRNIEPNDGYHKLGREYRLMLPLYNSVTWLEVGVPEGTAFSSLPVRPDKPIVVYGTSIAQGACASRPGMAWPAILGRKLDRPLINLGFSGNGKLDKSVVDLLTEIDAKLYVLDCLPNLTDRTTLSKEEVKNRLIDAVHTLKAKRPAVPILLAEHAGYTEEGINPLRRSTYQEVNGIIQEAFKQLQDEGIETLYLLPKKDFQQDIETMVDGTHPSDLGMMRYAEAYEKQIRLILKEPIGTLSTTRPCTQLREPNSYDWEMRHETILKLNQTDPPVRVVIGNSITNFWGGIPKAHRVTGPDSWTATFGATGVHNLGYGWDRIENVLWRVYHGELDGFDVKQIFINIGTNNLHLNTDEEIITGWKLMIEAIRERQSKASIIMIGVYPRRDQEPRVKALNRRLVQLTRQMKVHYTDAGKVFLQPNGKIDESLFSDGLHPNAEGYSRLGAALKPLVRE